MEFLFGDGVQVTSKILTNARIVMPAGVGHETCIMIDDGKIVEIGSSLADNISDDIEVIDIGGRFVAPGFIDLHLHGGNGCNFNESDFDSFDRIIEHHLTKGTTSCLATLYVDEKEKLISAIEMIAKYIEHKGSNSILKGIHLEGPFLNPKMKGAMNEDFVWTASHEKWKMLETAGAGWIRMMTLAPEVSGVIAIMPEILRAGVRLSIGHSDSCYDDVEAAVATGLTQVTHIFNAMHPMHHRDPGIVGAAFLNNNLKIHLIADGIHVHPAIIKMLYNAKGANGITLISDAGPATGKEDGTYDMAGQSIKVDDGKVCLEDGTLAGSILTMSKAVANMIEMVGVSLDDAVRMASLNPARVLGIEKSKGSIAVGKDADMVILDSDINVQMTLVGGEIMFKQSSSNS